MPHDNAVKLGEGEKMKTDDVNAKPHDQDNSKLINS